VTDFVEICGRNGYFKPETTGGCGKPITLVAELYRCIDCGIPFHKECLKKHFAKVIDEDDVKREQGHK
jgi:hypothetical protein